jgi:hypothetical protein
MAESEIELPLEELPKGRGWRKPHPRRGARRRRLVAVILTLGALFAIGAISVALFRPAAPRMSLTTVARTVAEQSVKAKLKLQAVTFSPPEWTRIDPLPEGKYEVSGWGSAANEAGRSASFTYSCTLSRQGSGWHVDAVTILPQ